jgi:hypothetical protein
VIALLALAAAAEPGACTEALSPPPDALSVAWVSPLGRHVASRGYLDVVPTADLRRWVADTRPGLGALLQHLGLRKRDRDPHRRYKVAIFDVARADLCRPVDDVEEGAVVAGVTVCPANRSDVNASDSCGSWRDAATGAPSFPLYRVRWLDAARDGFCVLPADRFLAAAP